MKTDISQIENLHKYSHNAMATVFELLIQCDDLDYSEKASWEAFQEIDRLEEELSRFNPNSEISRINNSKPSEKLILSPDTFECIRQALEVNVLTLGAFDITYKEGSHRVAPYNLILNEEEKSLVRLNDDTYIDLGGIGKGYAVEKVEEILREWGITNTLINGGFSTIKALDSPLGFEGWPISISDPCENSGTIIKFTLKDYSVSGSGLKKGMHIINPLTGEPAISKSGTWAVAKSAMVSDALSTAFMVMDNDKVKNICEENDGFLAVILDADYYNTKNIFLAGNRTIINLTA